MTSMTPRTLERSTVLAATPDQVWAAIGDFGGLADWHPYIQPSTIEDDADPGVPGAVRVFSVDGEIVARERLVARDADARWYRYVLLAPVMLPVGEFVATLAVHPHADGAEVRWSADYQGADEVVPQVESIFGDGTYGAGLDALRKRFSEG
ncbi:SRPBCC family protein [Streptomyces sp. NPDC090052]